MNYEALCDAHLKFYVGVVACDFLPNGNAGGEIVVLEQCEIWAIVEFVADAVGVEFAVVAVVIDLCFRQLCECQNGKYQCDYSLCHQIA